MESEARKVQHEPIGSLIFDVELENRPNIRSEALASQYLFDFILFTLSLSVA
jgi:hypothetical protein